MRHGKALFASVESERFRALPDKERGDFLASLALCAYYLDQPEDIRKYAMAATALGDNPIAWRLRLLSEVSQGLSKEAIGTIEVMTTRPPELLASIPVRWVENVHRMQRGDDQKKLRHRLLTALARNGFSFSDPTQSLDWMRAEYAILLVEAGNFTAATDLVDSIVDPATLRYLSLTPGVREHFPAHFDSRDAVEAELTRLTALSGEYPDRMELLLDIARMQRSLGKPEDALATLMLAHPAQTTGKFIDADGKANWWWNDISRTYWQLGRDAESETALRQGMAIREGNGDNISQKINLAGHFQAAGRNNEALAVLGKTPGGASPYGSAAWHTLRACALVGTGERDAALSELRPLQKLKTDHPRAFLETQICLGDYDAAANALIESLRDRKHASRMLLLLSEFDVLPADKPKSIQDLGLDKLRQRADVQAAIAAAGGTRRFRVVDEL